MSVYNGMSSSQLANEKKYLQGLINAGGGKGDWAKNQMNSLNKATSSGTGTSSTTPKPSGNTPKPSGNTPKPSGTGTSSTSTSPKQPNIVNTNTSYNGGYLNVDMDQDYKGLYDNAVSKGDYAGASYYEALRNAKINYLNSTGANGGGYTTTNNYVKDYGFSNNKDGMIYDNKINNITDLPDNWTTANVNGMTYKRDNGGIYQKTGTTSKGDNYGLVGNGINSNTGQFYFDNYEDARKSAYDSYIGVNGLGGKEFASSEDAYKYLDQVGAVDTNYINAVQKGDTTQYTADVMAKAEAEMEAKRLASLNDYSDLSDEDRQTVDDNSFETDLQTPTEQPTNNDFTAQYLEWIRQQEALKGFRGGW